MKKKAQLFMRRKIRMDVRGRYVRKFRIYPTFLYNHLDKWLKSMSRQGWHIVHCGVFVFWFEKGTPAEREYFTYGLATQEGKYNLSLQYPLLEKTYGLEKKKSKINSNQTKKHRILEVDLERFDIRQITSYQELIEDRNRLYHRYFLRNLAAMGIALIVVILLIIV